MLLRRRSRAAAKTGSIGGIARVDKRTKRLVGRLQPGEIAVIDHDDLDRVAAEALVERKAKAVLNAAESTTGRYPNLGPLVLAAAGVPLVDDIGEDLFREVLDGDLITLDQGRILKDGQVVAKGEVIDQEIAQAKLDDAKRDIAGALEAFAENTLSYLREEKDLLIGTANIPDIVSELKGRHVLVVIRGYGYKEDLRSLREGYIPDHKPFLIGVDGGADALLEIGLRPAMIIGDMDSVSTQALTGGAELVLHAYSDGNAPGKERLDALGLDYRTFESPGTSEDIALLLAHEKGAELIVAVGARASLVEMMDKGRKGMASTFLVRLRVGPKLVDAKGVSELHIPGPSRKALFGLVVAAVVALIAVVAQADIYAVIGQRFSTWLADVWFQITQGIS